MNNGFFATDSAGLVHTIKIKAQACQLLSHQPKPSRHPIRRHSRKHHARLSISQKGFQPANYTQMARSTVTRDKKVTFCTKPWGRIQSLIECGLPGVCMLLPAAYRLLLKVISQTPCAAADSDLIQAKAHV
jgi:hypothetical protein